MPRAEALASWSRCPWPSAPMRELACSCNENRSRIPEGAQLVKQLLFRRPSPALIVACVALFVSLGGVSYGVATGFIDSREIKNNEVRSLDVRNNEIRTRDLRNNEV